MLIALVATWTVWRVSRKLLLITCFLLMWHIWVVVFLLERHFTTELPLVGAFLSCSYVLFYEWALGPLRFIICYEMEGIFGNILLNIEFAVLQCLREVFFEQYTRIIDKHIQISFILINFLVSRAPSLRLSSSSQSSTRKPAARAESSCSWESAPKPFPSSMTPF